jgi:hypothetical protein
MRYIIVLIILVLTSCSKNYRFNRDQEIISKEMNNIKQTDQGVRIAESVLLLNRFKFRTMYTVTDSLSNAGLAPEEVFKFDLSKLPRLEDQISKLPTNKKDEYHLYKQRAEKVTQLVDSINAQKLYATIKKYGFISFYKRAWRNESSKIGITTLLTHIDPKSNLGQKLTKLMIKEYFHGRVDDGEMKHYMWHVDGRKNEPPYSYVLDNVNLKKRLHQ